MPSERALKAAEKYNRLMEQTNAPGRCDPDLQFETPQLIKLLSVWQEHSAGRDTPLRRDLNAHSLRAFLPNIIIVDVVKQDDRLRYRIRLTGTVISTILGDHTGKFVDDAVVSPFRERWNAAFDLTVETGGPILLKGRLEYREQHYLVMEILLAPMAAADGAVDSVLVGAYAKYSARHVFDPLVRNALAATSER